MERKINTLMGLRDQLFVDAQVYPVGKRLVVQFDEWSFRDIVAHLSAWHLLRIKEIESFLNKLPVDFIEDYDTFNQSELAKRQHYTWDMIFDEFVSSFELMVTMYHKIPKVRWKEKIWSDREVTPVVWLQTDIDHVTEHSPQFSA